MLAIRAVLCSRLAGDGRGDRELGSSAGTATSTSFWTIFYAFPGTMRPNARRVICSAWCPGLPDADWGLESDVVTNSGVQACIHPEYHRVGSNAQEEWVYTCKKKPLGTDFLPLLMILDAKVPEVVMPTADKAALKKATRAAAKATIDISNVIAGAKCGCGYVAALGLPPHPDSHCPRDHPCAAHTRPPEMGHVSHSSIVARAAELLRVILRMCSSPGFFP